MDSIPEELNVLVQSDIDVICHYVYKILEILFKFILNYGINILIVGIVIIVLYTLYKSYISPYALIKELSDIGFSHLPTGKDRDFHISRALNSRKNSSKLPPPYPNGWFALVESADLKVGDVKAVDALGQNLCVYRGKDGVPRVVDAYCPHLGANMGIGGRVDGNCIECPFHRWKFAEDGKCVAVQGNDTVPKGVSIKTWTCVEVEGAVWFWYDAEGREPLWPMEQPELIKNWGYRGRNEFVVSSHIQEIPENASDAAHLDAIHVDSVLPILKYIIGHHQFTIDWSRCEMSHVARIDMYHEYKIGKYSIFTFTSDIRQIGPGHVRLTFMFPFGELFISLSVTPLEPLLQRVVHRVYTPTYNAIFAGPLLWGETQMFSRDMEVWNSKQFLLSPVYAKSDKSIKAFRAWYSQFYSENSITFREAVQNPLDW